ADARRFVRVTETRYDVIVADLFHPARDGAGALYTREHFQAIRQRLAGGGLFCQWLPLFQLDEPILKVIVRTFLEVFPHTRGYLLRLNVDTPVLGLVGTPEPIRYPANWFGQRVRDPKLLAQLKSLTLMDEFQLFGCLLAAPDALRDFSRAAPLNTDDHPVVLFQAPQFDYVRKQTPYGRLLTLLDLHAADARELIQSDGDPADRFIRELSDFIAARDVYVHGLVAEAEAEGNTPRAVDAFVESARISPDFSTGYAKCLTIAMQESKSNPAAARELLQRLVEAQPSRPIAQELLQRLQNQ
ncbi:MAG: spermidine synthase, partial [Verrucomicrobiota bacterium]